MNKKPDNERRIFKLTSYGTQGEHEITEILGRDHGYNGAADAIRHGLALLVHTRHKDLVKYLRSDLQTPLTNSTP